MYAIQYVYACMYVHTQVDTLTPEQRKKLEALSVNEILVLKSKIVRLSPPPTHPPSTLSRSRSRSRTRSHSLHRYLNPKP